MEKSFCSLGQLVWKSCPLSNFFIHFVYGKNKKYGKKFKPYTLGLKKGGEF
jgi:hypothetical protein